MCVCVYVFMPCVCLYIVCVYICMCFYLVDKGGLQLLLLADKVSCVCVCVYVFMPYICLYIVCVYVCMCVLRRLRIWCKKGDQNIRVRQVFVADAD